MIRFFFKKKPELSAAEIKKIRKVIKDIAAEIIETEDSEVKSINYIFCSDKYIRKVNKQFLNHDYETDIITFYDSDANGETESDIVISVDTVSYNAERYKVDLIDELFRVAIHGVLHLSGYDDKKASDKKIMQRREAYYLKKANEIFKLDSK